MQTAVQMKTAMQFQDTCSWLMVALSCGQLKHRKLLHCLRPKQNMSLLPMPQRKHCGYAHSLAKSLVLLMAQRPSTVTTSQQSPSPKMTSSMPIPSTLISAIILFAMSSRTTPFISSTAQLMIWLQTCLPKHYLAPRWNISPMLLDCIQLEGGVSEVSDNLVSSRERVVKLGSALSHIPLCHAFTYLIDGWLTFVCCYIPCHESSAWLSEPISLTVFSLLYVDSSTSAFVSKAEVRSLFPVHYEYNTNCPT